jgi:nucleotide-binding universal stress UspA family protein
MKILLPVDGSDYTKRMLSYIAAHDELLGPGHEYILLHAVAPVPTYASRFISVDVVHQHYREAADEVLKPALAFATQNGWKVRVAHAHGHAAETIAGIAISEHADLIVMGSHGYSAIGILGSVAMGVLARCKTPVLLVR